MRKKNLFDYFLTFFTSIIILPLSLVFMNFFRGKKHINNEKIFGMGISLEKGNIQIQLIDELNVDNILIRFPLKDIEKIEEYKKFIKRFSNKNILLNVLQNRENIEDLKLFEKNITQIFATFSPYISEFQIGNAINRTKWGFFGIGEYLNFFEVALSVRDKKFRNLTLIGSSIIDFEYYYTSRTLFNFRKIKFDKLSALLYVDRRGAPENKQYLFFDTINKIKLLFSLVKLSPKTDNKIIISEVNWPISNTAPFAPTSEKECISEECYANFMARYYLLSIVSGQIETIYWHQLIARGYGLIDDINGFRKRKAFFVFKTMVEILKDTKYLSFSVKNELYIMKFKNQNELILVYWNINKEQIIDLKSSDKIIDSVGKELNNKIINIKGNLIYAFKKV